jgi:putative transposase
MMPLQGSLSIERMCQLVPVSRASFYRWLAARAPAEENVAIRAAIQEIALAHRRRYGYRRVAYELRERGWIVNRKRVARLMREDNLLALRGRKYVATTDSDHDWQVYVNVAAKMRLSAINQLWVADITYIRLQHEFVYLAVVLDAFSRRVVGWALERTLHKRLSVTALQRAIEERRPPPGLVHHSDRGVQYAAHEYVQLLLSHGIVPSMSRPGNPYDNAMCESFMKTLKQEEIYCNEYADLDQLYAGISRFIDDYYNCCRLHSALGYRTPHRAEADLKAEASNLSRPFAALSFARHEEIYPSDVGRAGRNRSCPDASSG